MTKWGKKVTPENAWKEYPRPQMVRKDWQNLNGLWDYAITPKDEAKPEKWDGQILVPFPVESALSGVGKHVTQGSDLWYRRTFEVPAGWKGQRVLLHFGAVDWEATVFVNGKEVGTHRGGYDPFTFDITDALKDGQERTRRPRLGPDRRRRAAARQAGAQARRHLVHAGHRHLADGVARAGAGDAHHERAVHARTSTRARSTFVVERVAQGRRPASRSSSLDE